LRIGINALYLIPGKVGGTEVYIRNLVKWLPKVDRENDYIIFINKESIGVFDELVPKMKIVLCPVKATNRPLRILWEQFALPVQMTYFNIDVLLSAGMTCPFFSPATSVLVVHDLQHINQPQNFAWYYLPFLKTIIYLSAKTSDALIAVSGHVKEDIVKHYKIPPDRIFVTYIAVDGDIFFKQDKEDIEVVRQRYNLPERFIFYPASSLPHKNHKRLLEAFKTVKKEVRDIKLVLTGSRDYGYEVIEKNIKEFGLIDDVLFLGWLSHDDVPLIYNAASALIFPSLHEGFGMPVLEAMASGVPVVCSAIPPIKEVAGSAAIFVDPFDIGDIARGILSVLTDHKLREELIEDGLERAGMFTWEKTALSTLSAINSCIIKP